MNPRATEQRQCRRSGLFPGQSPGPLEALAAELLPEPRVAGHTDQNACEAIADPGGLLLIRNQDVPGVIGRVGTYLGDVGVNIADMAVGRHPDGGAMIGLSLDRSLNETDVAAILAIGGVAAARYIHLG